jgi:transposase
MSLTREQLLALDKETLVEIALQQSARIAELESTLAALAQRIAELEARLNQNSKNSSKPPSTDPPFSKTALKKPESTKKSGGQPGHEGHGLGKVEAPERVESHLPHQCHHCGCWLENEPATPAGSWQVFDLPAELKIEVVEHRRLSRRCPWCLKQSLGALPAWLCEQTPCQWGPRCRALGVYLMGQQHLPYERTRSLFLDLFGSAPSEGTLYRWQERAYQEVAPVEAAIAQALVKSEQVGADETPARGAGWLHTLVNEHWTWYGCHAKRGREAMEHFGLLPRFSGLLMSDCLSSYAIYGGERSLCNAHLLRELVAMAEQGHLWAERMTHLLLSVKERVERLGAPLARSALQALYRWFGRLLAMGRRENQVQPVAKSASLLSRLENCRDEYLRFASVAGAWFDNNISERALRMMKVHVKVSGCFRSSLGCQILCRVRGYLSTMKKQGQALMPALVSVMEGRPVLPPLLQAQAAN